MSISGTLNFNVSYVMVSNQILIGHHYTKYCWIKITHQHHWNIFNAPSLENFNVSLCDGIQLDIDWLLGRLIWIHFCVDWIIEKTVRLYHKIKLECADLFLSVCQFLDQTLLCCVNILQNKIPICHKILRLNVLICHENVLWLNH